MGKNQALAYMQLYKTTGDDRYLQLYNLEVSEAQGKISKEQHIKCFKKSSTRKGKVTFKKRID